MIRIGVMDEEEGYVSKLTAYLNRVNKGTMQCCAFTKKEGILTGLKDHRWDVLAATDRAFVEEMLEEDDSVCGIWLTGPCIGGWDILHISISEWGIYCRGIESYSAPGRVV